MILNFGMIFVFLSNSILTGAGDTTTPFMVAVVQSLVALATEYCLIYGAFGFPALGIHGAALGLVTGHVVSALVIARTIRSGKTRAGHHSLCHLAHTARPSSVSIGKLSFTVAVEAIRPKLGPLPQSSMVVGWLNLSTGLPSLLAPVIPCWRSAVISSCSQRVETMASRTPAARLPLKSRRCRRLPRAARQWVQCEEDGAQRNKRW